MFVPRVRLEEKQAESRKLHGEYVRYDKIFKQKRAELQQIKEIADREAPLEDENGNDLPLKAELEALAVENQHEAQAALDEAEIKINSIVADPKVVQQYEQRQQEIEQLEQELDDVTMSKDAKLKELDRKRVPWETALTKAVEKINAKFSFYMAELGCTGELLLVRGFF